AEGLRSLHFGQLAGADATPEVDLEQAVLRGDPALGEEQVFEGLRVDMWDAPTVAQDFNLGGEAGNCHGGGRGKGKEDAAGEKPQKKGDAASDFHLSDFAAGAGAGVEEDSDEEGLAWESEPLESFFADPFGFSDGLVLPLP